MPLPQTPPVQEIELQHCEELVQEAPGPRQLVAPVQTPPEQVKVPQHCEELVQKVPALWQPPPLQTLLELQVSTPQQSPLDWQRWLTSWHGPVRLGSTGGSGVSPVQASARASGAVSKATRRKVLRGGTMRLVYLQNRLFSRLS